MKNKDMTLRDVPHDLAFFINKKKAIDSENKKIYISDVVIEMLDFAYQNKFRSDFNEKEKKLREAHKNILELAGNDAAETFRKSSGLKKLDELITEEVESKKKVEEAA